MKEVEEEVMEKAEQQIRLRETRSWTWEEIDALMYAPIHPFEMED